jgi:type II secretory pathway predicted ATPase ExeA
MYEQFYGLTDKPFSLTPNPRFVFYSQQYREAEGQLLYGINNREGFMLVTGQPGTGKTTLCRDLIEKLDRERTQSALIFNPFLNGVEMLASLLTEFGVSVPPDGTRKDLLDRLNQFLLAQLALGKSCIAIFDEAQHLSSEFLEQIRVLSNLETDQEKLIQIVLVGQPELLEKIRTPKMAQLDQRVSIRCTLTDLDEQETDRYIHHRLNVAGARGQIHFSPRAVTEIYRASHGVPRLINLVCDRALLAGYAEQTRDIQPQHVRKAIAALRGEDAEVSVNVSAPARRGGRLATVLGGVVVVAALGVGGMFWESRPQAAPDQAAFTRATSEPTASAAEHDLESFVNTYPTSPHMDEALLRLGQLETSRGDRVDAIAHFTQLAHREAGGAMHVRAVELATAARFDAGDTAAACAGLDHAPGSVPATAASPAEAPATASGDTTLDREMGQWTTLCASRTAAGATPPDSNPAAGAAAAHDNASTTTGTTSTISPKRGDAVSRVAKDTMKSIAPAKRAGGPGQGAPR